ncbi:MAG: BrnT family toxin [Deltaproteobacteria bacterium]|nr:MAG: BrnT family toxin [Deltaproteobacteria bacterium]
MRFTWDPQKAASNLKKHGVSFIEAASVFADPLAAMVEDALDPERAIPDRSVREGACSARCLHRAIRGHDSHHQRETRYVP